MTKDIILTLIALAGIISFFYNPLGGDMKYLQIILGGIIGYYTGIKDIPLGAQINKLRNK